MVLTFESEEETESLITLQLYPVQSFSQKSITASYACRRSEKVKKHLSCFLQTFIGDIGLWTPDLKFQEKSLMLFTEAH